MRSRTIRDRSRTRTRSRRWAFARRNFQSQTSCCETVLSVASYWIGIWTYVIRLLSVSAHRWCGRVLVLSSYGDALRLNGMTEELLATIDSRVLRKHRAELSSPSRRLESPASARSSEKWLFADIQLWIMLIAMICKSIARIIQPCSWWVEKFFILSLRFVHYLVNSKINLPIHVCHIIQGWN